MFLGKIENIYQKTITFEISITYFCFIISAYQEDLPPSYASLFYNAPKLDFDAHKPPI